MTSPARESYLRKKAAQQTSAAPLTRADLNLQQQMMAMLYDHKRSLKQIQSVSAKGIKKAEFIPEYVPYIKGVVQSDSGLPDEVVTTIMLWCIDAGLIPEALEVAAYVLRHNLALPEQFNRTANVAIAEEIADLALKPENPVTADDLVDLYELVGSSDMPDQVRVKLEKACGLGLKEVAQERALEHFKRALQLNDRSGVKNEIAALEKQLAEQANSAPNIGA